MANIPRLRIGFAAAIIAGAVGFPSTSQACWLFGCWGAPYRSCYPPALPCGSPCSATGWAPAGAYTSGYVPYVSYNSSVCGCNPCCSTCGSSNCPSGDCSLTTRKPPTDSGDAEPTPVKVPVKPQDDPNKAYKDPPADEFRPTRPEENDVVPNRLGTPSSTIPRTTPQSTIPAMPKSTIPGSGNSGVAPQGNIEPNNVFPGTTIPESSLPTTRPAPLGNAEDSAQPEFRRPAPADPSAGSQLDLVIPDTLPNTQLEPLDLDSTAEASVSITRGRVTQTAAYRMPVLAKLKFQPVTAPIAESQVARK